MDEWVIGNAGQNCVQNIFCNTSKLLEQPLLLYIIVTAVWSECNIFVCYLCKGNWCIFIVFVVCENTDSTWLNVIPVDCHIVVSICSTLLVEKSQSVQQLMYNCTHWQTSVALEVELLALWVIEYLWLTISRRERHSVTTRGLNVACVSAEATTSSQTSWSQQNMSNFPVICENQQCENVQGDGQRPEGERNFGEIAVVGSDCRVEGITDRMVMEDRESKGALQVI